MNENTNIVLNLQSPNISTVVYAVQNDRLSRHITAQLLDGVTAWTPPAGSSAAIRYLKPDGTAGFYDVDEDGNAAIVISGSTATLTIAEQALTVPGDVYMQLNFYTAGGDKLTTFAWLVRVQKSVIADAEIVSSDYFNTLTDTIAQGIEVAQQLTYPVPVNNGGTGASTVAGALVNLGLDKANVYFGAAQSISSVDITTVGISFIEPTLTAPSVTGYTFQFWIIRSGTYRAVPLGTSTAGPSRIYYYVGATGTTASFTAIPVYTKN